jgi:hypothetical protein
MSSPCPLKSKSSGRSAHHQMGRDSVVGLLFVLSADQALKSGQSSDGELRAGEANGGQGRLSEVRERDVVEADQRNIAGNLESGVMNGAERADGGQVIRGDYGGWAFGQTQKIAHRADAALDAVVALLDQIAADVDPARFHSGDVGIKAALCGLQIQRAGNEGDPAVVEGEKMLKRFLNALSVIDVDVCAMRGVFAGVHENGGNVSAGEFGKHSGIGLRGHNGGTVDFAFEHAANALGHAFRFVVGVGDDDFEALLHGLVFEMFYEFGKERISDIGNDEAEHTTAAGDQGASVGVGIEIEFFDGLLHACRGAGADLVRTVDGAGDSGGGDFRELGDLFDVHRDW